MSKNYIFKEENGSLEFVGNFEALYLEQTDPWEQSGTTGQMKEYYERSRQKLNDCLRFVPARSLLEIGCGLGYTTHLIQDNFKNCVVDGMDISPTAIDKAKNIFPKFNFFVGDIKSNNFCLNKKYDVILLNQLLWYVLESLDQVFFNCFSNLNSGGHVVISQAFFNAKSSQKYGKEICDGFQGLLNYLSNNTKSFFEVIYEEYNDSTNDLIHDHGLIVLRKLA